MREKRVNQLVVLTCSVLVATCASVSHCFVTANSLDWYVTVVSTAIPIFLSGQIRSANAATVWIPQDDTENTEGSVNDEFQEVAHVFARPDVRVVKSKDEDEITQQAVPWMSLKDEWKIFQRVQSSERKKPGEKLKKKTGESKQQQETQADDEGSSEEDDAEDEEDEEDQQDQPPADVEGPPQADDEGSSEEDDGAEGRSSIKRGAFPSILAAAKHAASELPPLVKKATSKKASLPLAFYGQGNHDDDENDFLKDEESNFKNKRPSLKKISTKKKVGKNDEDNEEEDDDGSSSDEHDEQAQEDEAASVEDYADYALDDDNDADTEDKQGSKKNAQSATDEEAFQNIPLAIREMILNDLASQNNGTGYVPNLTPKVTSGSTENDDVSRENSSEEDAAELPQGDLGDPDPTPPAIRGPSKQKKGDDDEDDVNDDGHGGGKKGKGKKKKGKKKGGWGWKPQGWGQIHGWGGDHHKHHDHGWGWGNKHDGVLEQLVKGSTWEKVLQYYHWKRDESAHDHHHHHHGHDGSHGEHLGHEFAGHGIPHHQIEDYGWGWKGETGIKKAVKKAFKGSFWERAVRTYAKYKENQSHNPKKPTLVDLDTDHLNLGR